MLLEQPDPGDRVDGSVVVEAMTVLRGLVHRQTGLAFGGDQTHHFVTRVTAFCAHEGLGVDELVQKLRRDEGLLQRLADALSTPHTCFWREPEAFAALHQLMLPAFRQEPEVRLWSAASAAGDEAYSMAMVARECFGDEGPVVRILGTDLSAQQVALAERGVVPASRLGELDAGRRARWLLAQADGRFRVAPELQARCAFRRMNLTAFPWPFERGFHVIFLRNVLYYFDDVTVTAVLEAAHQALVPGGFLVTSVTEPLARAPSGFRRVGPAIYRQVQG